MGFFKKVKKFQRKYEKFQDKRTAEAIEKSKKNQAYYEQLAKTAKAKAQYNKTRPPSIFEGMAAIGNSPVLNDNFSGGGMAQQRTKSAPKRKAQRKKTIQSPSYTVVNGVAYPVAVIKQKKTKKTKKRKQPQQYDPFSLY